MISPLVSGEFPIRVDKAGPKTTVLQHHQPAVILASIAHLKDAGVTRHVEPSKRPLARTRRHVQVDTAQIINQYVSFVIDHMRDGLTCISCPETPCHCVASNTSPMPPAAGRPNHSHRISQSARGKGKGRKITHTPLPGDCVYQTQPAQLAHPNSLAHRVSLRPHFPATTSSSDPTKVSSSHSSAPDAGIVDLRPQLVAILLTTFSMSEGVRTGDGDMKP